MPARKRAAKSEERIPRTPSKEEFAAIVRALRAFHDWTQKELGDTAGVDTNTIGNAESGATDPDLNTVVCVLGAFGMDPTDLGDLWKMARWISGKRRGEPAEIPYGWRLDERASSIVEPGTPVSDNRQRAAELGRAVAEVIEPILDYVRARPP